MWTHTAFNATMTMLPGKGCKPVHVVRGIHEHTTYNMQHPQDKTDMQRHDQAWLCYMFLDCCM